MGSTPIGGAHAGKRTASGEHKVFRLQGANRNVSQRREHVRAIGDDDFRPGLRDVTIRDRPRGGMIGEAHERDDIAMPARAIHLEVHDRILTGRPAVNWNLSSPAPPVIVSLPPPPMNVRLIGATASPLARGKRKNTSVQPPTLILAPMRSKPNGNGVTCLRTAAPRRITARASPGQSDDASPHQFVANGPTNQATSNNPAAPMPPPTHIVTTTNFAPRRLPSISA